ncbi:uncharacterized protein LOC128881959 [Hylaeus volcanicus]|uniref:uncharacterized protein LOC128881959 n=1 Tax=Hylaeus volcanicus TaxID=313075 RepID=UPI0023B86D79|nr:uncharacterized protein LOC128881959 [Hylaeus volcanicus]
MFINILLINTFHRTSCITSPSAFKFQIIICLISLILIQKARSVSRTDLMKCKLTHKGIEYRGSIAKTISGIQCQAWYTTDPMHEVSSYIGDHDFPERSMKNAKNYCRNPTEDAGGPWCYTMDASLIDDKCDVPLCNFGECKLSGLGSEYGGSKSVSASGSKCKSWQKHYILEDRENSKFYEKDFPDDSIKKAGSFCRNPSGDIGGPWCYIKQKDTEYVEKEYCDVLFCDDRDCLAFTKNVTNYSIITKLNAAVGNTSFWIKLWNPDDEKRGEARVLLSVLPVLFSTDETSEEWGAGVELAFRNSGSSQTFPSNDVRTFNLVDTFELISILISKLGRRNHRKHSRNLIGYKVDRDMDNMGCCHGFRTRFCSIFGEHLRLFSQSVRGAVELLYINNNFFATLRWFSIGSESSIAQWTLFCSPEAGDAVEEPTVPNCISDSKGYEYKGSQWTSVSGVPCVPWMSKEVPNEEKADNKFVDGSAMKALNKCRNPTRDDNGVYCYAFTSDKNRTISKQYCAIRTCRSSECKMAGTANDYVGTLSTTRSGRTCDNWPLGPLVTVEESTDEPLFTKHTRRPTRVKPPRRGPYNPYPLLSADMPTKSSTPKYTTTPVSKFRLPENVIREYFNDTLYADGNARSARNYCRNPSRNIAGTWCYTTDSSIPQDLCNVRDCEKPEEYTILVKGDATGRRLYVLPEYRFEGLRFALKAWEPDRPDSITFVFSADDGFKSRYILKIGALDNEKVLLYYQSESEVVVLVKKKTLPHLLYLGKWANFILSIPRGKILLYYEDEPTPIFEWSHSDPTNAFLPTYYYYSSERGRTVGIAFNYDSGCPVETTRTDRYVIILPLSVWNQEGRHVEQVTLHVRGDGAVSVPLFLLPGTPGFYALTLSETDHWITFTKNAYPNVTIFHRQRLTNSLFTTRSWTNITIRWSGNSIKVFCNATNVFLYKHVTPLLFYYFSVGVASGSWITWTVNCLPIDIDGPPIDGGWSEWGPWACSASCNGGTGIRRRRCNSPKPNIKGEPCIGTNTMTGRCNEIVCGDITEDTVNLITRRMQTNYTALIVKEFRSTKIVADYDIVELIVKESPRSEMQWSLNGIFVQNEPSRVELKDYNIEIIRASPNDSGVYAMTLRRIDGTYSIIKVISLAVIPLQENVRVRETLSVPITCHCTILGHVYSELRVSWQVKNKTWKDYGITLPFAVDTERILAVNRTHEGMWQCSVKQNDLNFNWVTNIIFFKVLGPPNWRTYLMEDQATRFIFGWLPNEKYVSASVIIISFILVSAIIVGSIFFIRNMRINKELNRQYVK